MANNTTDTVETSDRPISIAFLRTRYSYCPLTGIVRHLSGKEAGYRGKKGYRAIKVSFENRRIEIASHIIGWALHHDVWPQGELDHRDTIRDNNRIANLRESTRIQNMANRNKIAGLFKGVSVDKNRPLKPYRAQLKHQKRNRYLGNYATPEEAHAAYMAVAVELFGEFARA